MIDSSSSSLSLLAMFMVGLIGSTHCIGMCGGITTALGMATRGRRRGLLVVGYNIGRITSYMMAGALVATLGYWGATYLNLGPVLRVIAGVILILMGFYLGGWWSILLHLEKIGATLWKKLQPLGNKLMPVHSFSQSLALGALWGWLPCGLVYTALAYSATAETVLHGALMMAAFGLGTAPAMMAGGLFSSALKSRMQNRRVRAVMGILMILLGLWTLYGATMHIQHAPVNSSEHHHHQQ